MTMLEPLGAGISVSSEDSCEELLSVDETGSVGSVGSVDSVCNSGLLGSSVVVNASPN